MMMDTGYVAVANVEAALYEMAVAEMLNDVVHRMIARKDCNHKGAVVEGMADVFQDRAGRVARQLP